MKIDTKLILGALKDYKKYVRNSMNTDVAKGSTEMAIQLEGELHATKGITRTLKRLIKRKGRRDETDY